MSEMSLSNAHSHCMLSGWCADMVWTISVCKLCTDPLSSPNYSTHPVPGGASRQQMIHIASKLSSVAESVQVCIQLMDQQQLYYDDALFCHLINFEQHVLHAFLPEQNKHSYNLRPRPNNLSLSRTMDHRNFIPRLAFKNSYLPLPTP